MTRRYERGDSVVWRWGNVVAQGKVKHISRSRTEIQTNGQTIHRNGSDDNPALTIKQNDGTQVLKLASEVECCD